MEAVKNILEEEFNQIGKDLYDKHIELGMQSSGKWLRDLVVDVQETGLGLIKAKVIGNHYTYQLINGRKPGRMPPIDAIKQWILTKSRFNQAVQQINLNSLAFVIARKIAERGTQYYQDGGTELVSSVVTEDRINNIIQRVSAAMIEDASLVIQAKLEEISV